MFNKKRSEAIERRWGNTPVGDRVTHQMKDDAKYLMDMVYDLRHRLDSHLDKGETEECPGCYLEKVWEKIIKKLEKQIKDIKKWRKSDNDISDQIIQNMAKVFKALLDSSSSTAFFFIQQAYGEMDWPDAKKMMENYAKWAKPVKKLKKT